MRVDDWADTAVAYSGSFARLCASTIAPILDAVAAVPPGRLLDVGSGAGELAAAASDRGYDVTAVDAAPSMVALAAARHPGIPFSVGMLPGLAFADAGFDVVTANFVVNHLPDPRAGVRELARVCRPDGLVAATIWPSELSPMNALFGDVVRDSDAVPLAGQRLPEELDFERSCAGLAGLFAEAGLGSVAAVEVSWSFDIAPAALWTAIEGGIAGIGLTYRAQDAARRQAMRDAYDRRAADITLDGMLRLPSTAVLAVGRV